MTSPVEGVLAAETVGSVVVALDGDAAGRHRFDLAVGAAGGVVAAADARSGAASVEVAAGGPGREYVRLQGVTRRDEDGNHGGELRPLVAVSFAAPVCAGSVSLVLEVDDAPDQTSVPPDGVRLVAGG